MKSEWWVIRKSCAHGRGDAAQVRLRGEIVASCTRTTPPPGAWSWRPTRATFLHKAGHPRPTPRTVYLAVVLSSGLERGPV